MFARSQADVGRLLPSTAAFDAAANSIKKTPISKGGALFLDKSDLWEAEAQANVSDALHFSKYFDMLIGGNWKEYILNSQGTLFIDTTGVIKLNEYGGYVQLKKKFLHDIFTVTVSERYDKHTNFDGRFTPRFTVVGRIAPDNFLRFS